MLAKGGQALDIVGMAIDEPCKSAASPMAKRRWWQFSARGLLLGVAVVAVALSVWTGGNLAVVTHHLKTVTLGELPPGTWQVVVQRPDGTEVDRQRFTVG